MHKKLIVTFLIIILQIGAVFFLQNSAAIYQLPQITLQQLPTNINGIIIPLDGRPPCLDFPLQLARIGALELNHPPRKLLGNYQDKADTDKIHHWLYDNTTKHNKISILSTDMLIHGGLVASREAYNINPQQAVTLQMFSELHHNYPNIFLSAFTIIPRLTIAENNQTSPWQWHMREYTILQDIVNTFDDPIAFKKWQSFDKVIPNQIKIKYRQLYAINDQFNQLLIAEYQDGILNSVTIGQDDADVFGLPNHNLRNAGHHMPSNRTTAQITRGADELGQLLVAQYLNIANSYQPTIYVQYSNPDTAYKIMPYMSCSVQETVEEKVAIINGTLTTNPATADFILYVHCGEEQDSISAMLNSARQVKQMLQNGNRIALVDLSRNFRNQDTLLPYLLIVDAPLSQLIAYAGWNTTSNSVGTAVTQASIFNLQLRKLPTELLPNLYHQNLQFTLTRFLDDWAYQKNIQHQTNYNLTVKDINTYQLADKTKVTEDIITQHLRQLSMQLLYLNISRHAFYQTTDYKYLITQLQPSVTLPWQRTFEINLQLTDSVALQKIN